MSDQAHTAALAALSSDVAVLSSKIDDLGQRAEKRGGVLDAILARMDSHIQESRRTLAAHDVRIASEKEAREAQDKRIHALSNRVWALGGGSGVLASVALLLQMMGW